MLSCSRWSLVWPFLLSRLCSTVVYGLGVAITSRGTAHRVRQQQQHQKNGVLFSSTTTTTTTTSGDVFHSVERMPWTMNPDYDGYSMEQDWGWAFTSVSDEAVGSYVIREENIEGTIPSDLRGTLYRNGPGKLERGGQRYTHVFDGDGFIAALSFLSNGQVQYTGRFVETEYFVREEEQNAILYRNALGTERPGGVLANVLNVNLKNVANTNVVEFGKRLFAFWEAGSPYELDPTTLETLLSSSTDTCLGPTRGLGAPGALRGVTVDDGGPLDQQFGLARAFTAHPHVDMEHNRLVAFRWAQHALRKDMRLEFLEYKDDWTLNSATMYAIDGCNLAPHDFGVFSHYYGFFENRMEMDTLPFLMGLKGAALCMSQRLDLPTRLHLVPRSNSDSHNDVIQDRQALQLSVPSFFSIHTLSPGMETKDPVTGDTILTLLSSGWDTSDTRLFPNQNEKVPFLGAWGGPFPDFDIMPPSQLWRTVVNVDKQIVERHGVVIPGINLEYPRVDDRYPHVVYAPCSWIKPESGRSDPPTGFCRIDTTTDTVQYWWGPPKVFCGELIPVPKRDKHGTEIAGGGSWLLSLVHDALRKRVSLVILDSERFEEGPVCWIHLQQPLTWGLHGSFTNA